MNHEPWLLLIHQLPPKPDYLRVKISRRLGSIGAVPIKSTVYALPNTDAAAEDFRWTIEEIAAGGGEANLCAARMLEGLSDQDVEELFRQAREADYAPLLQDIRALTAAAQSAEGRRDFEQEIGRMRKRLEEIRAIDFFDAPGGQTAEELLDELSSSLDQSSTPSKKLKNYVGRTWVTRANIQVDRMASAWLIKRFIDRKAQLRFVKPPYKTKSREIRFDMYDAEFTHQGDRCTFEVLLERTGLADRALRWVGEVVHDIDLKENRFDRPETAGIAALVSAIAVANRRDPDRVERSSALFDDLYTWFQRKGRRS